MDRPPLPNDGYDTPTVHFVQDIENFLRDMEECSEPAGSSPPADIPGNSALDGPGGHALDELLGHGEI